MKDLMHLVRSRKTPQDQIKSEWLGAEARIHLPSGMLARNRFMVWGWRFSVGDVFLSFLSGLTIGGSLALLARGQTGGRQQQ